MKLGEKIKLLRTKQQLTQPELAAKAGIEQSYLSKLENEKGSPSFDIINRIAKALGQSGMELIDSLSQSYVESNLNHIPEIAAEFSAVRHKQHKRQQRRFILAALVAVLGVGTFFVGSQSLLFPKYTHVYHSEGVIRPGEPLLQFSHRPIKAIAETQDAANQRMHSNSKRLNPHTIHINENKGWNFVVDVAGGKRHYEHQTRLYSNSMNNELIAIFGIMLIVTSAFMFWFSFQFKRS